ncbi:translation elongation factor, putative [Plasmodium ovale curtisi]|uniref:Translation elongation factor, putative n=1 Tax=Plasmodium ovale curtisi TaxID=864141 RepID=A0A1A8WPE2_PLAOA|nr:translation elongation factor, putative [Plasmodium ovale curtisi]
MSVDPSNYEFPYTAARITTLKECTIPLVTFGGTFANHLVDHFADHLADHLADHFADHLADHFAYHFFLLCMGGIALRLTKLHIILPTYAKLPNSRAACNANLLTVKGESDYNKLNAFFAKHSYYQNYALSALDVKIYNQIKCVIDKDMYPHLYRWYKHISSLPSAVLDQYTENTDKGKKGNTDEKKTNAKKSPAAANDDDVDNDIDLFGDNTDISKIPKLVKQKIVDENIKWGEEVKKLPVAFGLYKIHMSCIIYDDFVNTNELIDKIENIDLESEEDKKKRTLILGLDDEENEDYDGDENAEVEDDLDFLVQSAEIISFNKL